MINFFENLAINIPLNAEKHASAINKGDEYGGRRWIEIFSKIELFGCGEVGLNREKKSRRSIFLGKTGPQGCN